jgi:hypothetical protein
MSSRLIGYGLTRSPRRVALGLGLGASSLLFWGNIALAEMGVMHMVKDRHRERLGIRPAQALQLWETFFDRGLYVFRIHKKKMMGRLGSQRLLSICDIWDFRLVCRRGILYTRPSPCPPAALHRCWIHTVDCSIYHCIQYATQLISKITLITMLSCSDK